MTNPPRIRAVDDFRGFAIASMIMVNFSAFYRATPDWLRHAEGIGLTFADLVAPFFLFVLGMMYRGSMVRRIAKNGRRSTYLVMLRRYVLLLLIGLIGGAIGKLRITLDWGILQGIGLAGIIALPFMELRPRWRIVVGIVLLAVYQYALPARIHTLILDAEQGGPFATLAWATSILFASVGGDLLEAHAIPASGRRIALLGIGLAVSGLISTAFVPVNKHAVSPSYVLISTGLSAMTFAGFLILSEHTRLSIPTLGTLGRNALLLFLAHYILVRVGHRVLTRNAGLLLVMCGAAGIYALCYILAWYLCKRRIYVKV